MNDNQQPIPTDDQPGQVPSFQQPPAPVSPPISSAPPMPPVAPVSHKKRNILIAIIGVVVVLALGVGIGYAFFASKDAQGGDQQSQTAQGDSSSEQENQQLQPEDVTAKIKDTYASTYTLLNLDDNSQPKSNEISIRISKQAPAYKAEGYNFYTDYDGGSKIELVSSDADSTGSGLPKTADRTIRSDIAGIYTDFGLKKTETLGDTNTGNTIDFYTGKGLVCTIETPTAAVSTNTASCGLVASYNDAAAKVKPFADALPSATGLTVLSGLKISDSQVSGYQNATLNQSELGGAGGSVALFYKKDAGAWTYFINTQQALLCSKYNTVDLQNAFKGDTCYPDSGTGMSTVQ